MVTGPATSSPVGTSYAAPSTSPKRGALENIDIEIAGNGGCMVTMRYKSLPQKKSDMAIDSYEANREKAALGSTDELLTYLKSKLGASAAAPDEDDTTAESATAPTPQMGAGADTSEQA